MDILKIKQNGVWIPIPAIVGPSGTLVVSNTETGNELEIETIAGNPVALSVAFEWSQGDVTGISPQNPVPITTMEDCTISVGETDYETDFTTAFGAAGIGKGTYNALTGETTITQKAVVVTADMVIGKAKYGSDPDVYAADLDFGTSVYDDGGGILACSHYVIGNGGIKRANGHTYLYGAFENDLDAIKSYIAGLNMVVVFAIQTPEEHDVTAQNVLLGDGENTVSVDIGTMTLTYNMDAKQYIDASVDEVNEIATTAAEDASDAKEQAEDLQDSVDVINAELYKYRTQTGSNTGTGAAGASTNINWGFRIPVNNNNIKCRSVTVLPVFDSDSGDYTATRWEKISGTNIETGDVLRKVEEKTQAKNVAVTFENVGFNEFVSINQSIKFSTSTYISVEMPFGYIDPATGTYTSFNGSISGTITFITYKPIKDDAMLLFGKNITLIGDSITEKNGRAAINHGMWLERWTGCIIQNKGVGGTGFKRTAGTTYYKNRIASVNANADIIGVAASFNDMSYDIGTADDTEADDTVCGYANGFFDALLAAFPTKRIACYSEGPWYNYKPGVTKSDTFIAEMAKICANKGIVWDDGLYRGCALRPWMQENCNVYYLGEEGQYEGIVDNIHPNSAGQKIIARYLQKLFEKMVD